MAEPGITEKVVAQFNGTTVTEKYKYGRLIERTTVRRREDEPAVMEMGRAGTTAREPVSVRTERFAQGGERAGRYVYKVGEKIYDKTRSGTLVKTSDETPPRLRPVAQPQEPSVTPGKVKKRYIDQPGLKGKIIGLAAQADDLIVDIEKGAASYLARKVIEKQAADKEAARIKAAIEAGELKPLPEARKEAQEMVARGELSEKEYAEWEQQVLLETQEKPLTFEQRVEHTGAVILGTAAGGFSEEQLGRALFAGASLGTINAVGTTLTMVPSVPLQVTGWGLKFATTALVLSEGFKSWEAFQELETPAEKVGAVIGAVPSMYLGAKAYKVSSQVVYTTSKPYNVQRAVKDDLAMIDRAQKRGRAIVDTTYKTEVKDIPVIRTREYFLGGDLPDELRDFAPRVRYEAISGTKGKIVQATEIPARVWRTYSEGGRVAELTTDLATGRSAAMIYSGTSPASTLYIFEPKGQMNVYTVTFGAKVPASLKMVSTWGKAIKPATTTSINKVFSKSFKPSVVSEVITPVSAYSTAKMKTVRYGWEYTEVGTPVYSPEIGTVEFGYGRGLPAKVKLQYGDKASITRPSFDVYLYNKAPATVTVSQLPKSGVLVGNVGTAERAIAARVYTSPPELIIGQVTSVDYSVGAPMLQEFSIGPGSIPKVSATVRSPYLTKTTPAGMEATQYAPYKVEFGPDLLRGMQKSYDLEMFRVAREREQVLGGLSLKSVTVPKAIKETTVTIPKSVSLPQVSVKQFNVPAVGLVSGSGVKFVPPKIVPGAAQSTGNIQKVADKVMPLASYKPAVSSREKLSSRVSIKADLGTSAKAWQGTKVLVGQVTTPAVVTKAAAATMQIPATVATAKTRYAPPAMPTYAPLALKFGTSKIPAWAFPSFSVKEKQQRKKRFRLPKMKRYRTPRTFRALPDPLSLWESQARFGRATAPPQTRKLRRRYRKEVLFSPLTPRFPTLEQLNAPKRRKKKRKAGKKRRGKRINTSRRFRLL